MEKLFRRWRRACVIAVHLVLVVVANQLAFMLRFDGVTPAFATAVQLQALPWLIAIRLIAFAPFGVYQGLWRYAGIWDLRNIIGSVAVSSVAFYLVTRFGLHLATYPRGVLVIDALVLTGLCGGLRLARRLWGIDGFVWRRREYAKAKTVLIFGAGKAGELIARDIRNNPFYTAKPVGFVDDNVAKVGRHIHGIPVLGTRADLPRLMGEFAPDEVMIAMPSADPSTLRGVLKSLEPYAVHLTSLPNLRDVMDGVVTVNQIRPLAIEDLLPRAPEGLDEAPLRDLLCGRRVLVTGAGGSIGSELCLQIAALRPETLVLYERSENSLYTVVNLLADRGLNTSVAPVLGDITEQARLEATFAQYRPEIVFHAAAHKHVPLMESNPCEAVKNNVTGTRLVAEASVRHGVARMVIISTDKAVNPSSIMGATKRIAELVGMHQEGPTMFLTVRFGNVLGSNGSAIPRFLEQIRKGGPVTITHPEIRRYFMLLPEAVHLVLQVAGFGRSGGVYVLDMGEQIKMTDMARNLIRLSGLVPDEDIKLTFIGLRPGEKLFEELVGARETVQASAIPRVFEVLPQDVSTAAWFKTELRRVERAARLGDTTETIRSLRALVPDFAGRSWDVSPATTSKLRPRTVPVPLLPMWRERPTAAVQS